MKTYYDALGLPINAEPHQIEGAYRDLKDTFGTDSLATYSLIAPSERDGMLHEIEEAHAALSDPKRVNYDYSLIAKNPLLYKPDSFYKPAASRVETAKIETVAPVAVTHVSVNIPIEAIPPPSEKTVDETPPVAATPTAPVTAVSLESLIASISFYDGGALQRIRTARGLSVKDVAMQIKISPTQVRRIEEGDMTGLPNLVYVKGFLRVYARLLRIDADRLVKDYFSSVRNSLST